MKRLEVHNWIVAKSLFDKHDGQAIPSPTNGDAQHSFVATTGIKLSREEREDNLARGLAKLAYRCHVSPFMPS